LSCRTLVQSNWPSAEFLDSKGLLNYYYREAA